MKTLSPTRTVLALGTVALATLAMGSLAPAATGTANPGAGPTATASVPDWARGDNPDWDFLAEIRTSGMAFTRGWEADLESAGADLAQVDTFELRSQVCGSAMNDGTGGYAPPGQDDRFWLSTFHDEVRRMGRGGAWDIPRTVAYHHCPSRFEAVNAVQDLETRKG